MQLLLFMTSACHLCEQAEELLAMAQLSVELIDIAEQTQWQNAYALHIPVLYEVHSQKTLFWPFDLEQIKTFSAQLSNEMSTISP